MLTPKRTKIPAAQIDGSMLNAPIDIYKDGEVSPRTSRKKIDFQSTATIVATVSEDATNEQADISYALAPDVVSAINDAVPSDHLTDFALHMTTAQNEWLDAITVTDIEVNYLDGVTSNIQTQLNGKQATITGAATTVVSSDLAGSMALVSDANGKITTSATVSVTELG